MCKANHAAERRYAHCEITARAGWMAETDGNRVASPTLASTTRLQVKTALKSAGPEHCSIRLPANESKGEISFVTLCCQGSLSLPPLELFVLINTVVAQLVE